MPVHDWSKVDAGIFHHFHQRWITSLSDALNALLPGDYYALAEQVAEGPIPDVVTLERQRHLDEPSPTTSASTPSHTIAVADAPPRTQFVCEGEIAQYAAKTSRVAVYHRSGDEVIGYIEIVSPGNKHSEAAIRKFISKLNTTLQRGCHALVIDVHGPTNRDPRGIHARFWEEYVSDESVPGVTASQPLGMAAYRSDLTPTAYFEPFAVGCKLIDMPTFLTPDHYINTPLDATYGQAYTSVPRRWREVIEA